MKYDFKPEIRSKIRLFAHSGEAIVFWLCISGLIFWAFISLFRFLNLRTIVEEYHVLGKNVNPVIMKIEKLEASNQWLIQQKDSLKNEIMRLEERVRQLSDSMLQIHLQNTPGPEPQNQEADASKNIIDLPEN